MVNQAVDGGDGHGFVREDLIPAAEGLVGGDGDAAVVVAPGDQVEPVLFGQGGLEAKITTGDLKLLHQIAGSGVKDSGRPASTGA